MSRSPPIMVGVPILTFHTFSEERAADAFPPRLFARGMAALRALGYRAVDLSELVHALIIGAPFPERAFVLTFDDGYASIYEHLAPIVDSFGWKAVVFLTVDEGARDSAGLSPRFGRRMLSWGEIARLQRAGVTFGSHTLSHPDLTRLPASRVEVELVRSKELLEARLQTSVTTFAYPFGRHNQVTREIVGRHFAGACTDRLGIVHRGSDRYALERVDAHYLRDERLFRALPTKWFPLYLRARAGPRALKRALGAIVDR